MEVLKKKERIGRIFLFLCAGLLFYKPLNLFAVDFERMQKEIDGYLAGKKFNFEKTYIIKIGTLAPEKTPWTDIPRNYIIPKILDVSNGKVKVVLYSSGVMGDDPDVVRKVRLGQLQGCGCTATGLYILAPELSVFSLPFMFSDYEEVNYVLDRVRPDIEAILKKRNLFPFAIIHTGFMFLFSKEMINSLNTMRKNKVLTWFGKIEQETLKTLGINPIPLSVPEVVMGLRSGLITAHFSPPVWSLSAQAYLSTPFSMEPPFFYAPAGVIVDANSIKDIPSEAISLTKDIMKIGEKYWAEAVVEYEQKAISAFKEMGIKFVRMEEGDIKEVKKKSEELWWRLAEEGLYPRDFLEKVIRAKEEFKLKIKR
jgi:TRAP-type C4-dicarboxylate transport system substrate-binding protein